MKLQSIAAVAGLALELVSGASSAATITFDNLPGGDTTPFVIYSEAGFTATNSSGQFLVAKVFGNPSPDIFTLGDAGVTFTQDNGKLFTFSSVQLSPEQAPAPFVIQGLLGGLVQYTQADIAPQARFSFDTIKSAFGSIQIDALTISVSAGAARNVDVDNVSFALATVPLPASAPMFGAALLALGAAGYGTKRKKAAAVAA